MLIVFRSYLQFLLRIALILAMLFTIILGAGCQRDEVPEEPPNVLLIVSDDQRYDQMQAMPRTTAVIFDQGITFTNAYVTTARCCPSRSSILTGMYAHNHNVILNSDPLNEKTMVQYLDEQGYYTGLVGKYLNSYPISLEDPPRPEFDYWVGMASGPNNANYFDTPLNVNGKPTEHTGYQTNILRDYVLAFLRQAQAQADPFFLLFAPYAPHLPARPLPGDEQLFTDLPPHQPPNFNPEQMPGKPEWLQALPYLTQDQIDSVQRDWLHQLQTLNAFDIAIEEMVQELETLDMLENTIIIYLSDNGMFLGEHRMPIGKIYAYEESMRVPFTVYYPALIDKPREEQRLVANIDIAPTIYELAGIPLPDNVDGLSLLPLLQDRWRLEWREHLLLEGWPIDVAYIGDSPPFQAVHTERYVYIETEDMISELYDLTQDPYQLQSEVDNPAYADVLAEMQAYLTEERETIPPFAPR